MRVLLAALILLTQEPSTAELIRRLDADDIRVREETELALIARGAPALKEVEAALEASTDEELRRRLGRVHRKLLLADLVARIPAQFSEAFRAASPELMEQLKKAEPGTLIEAIAATTGHAWHWETVEKPGSHGSYKVPREIIREPVKGSTRSDAAEVILLSYRALPDPPLDARWTAVRSSARAAIRPDEGADRRRLYKLLLELRTDPDIPQLFQEMVAKCRGTEDIPFLLAVLEDPDRMISMYAAGNLRGTNPGPYADEIVKRLERAKPSHQATLLRCLQNSTDRRFLKLFLEKLEAPEPEARSAAFDAVAAWDPEALTEIVLGKLKSKNDDQIVPGLWMALKLKKPGQDPRPEFVKEAGRIFLENPDPKVSARAFGLLMWCVKSECFTLEVILHGLAHGNAGVRRQAAARGGELKGAEIIAALKRALDDPDDETAAFASISLFALKETVPVDRVRALLKSKERNAKSQAMRSLTYILGKEARPDLAALLDDPDISTQMMAIYHFGTLGVDGYEAKLRKKLEGEYNVSMAAARVLAPTGDAACWPVIKKYLGSDMHQLAPSAALLAYPGKAKALQAVVLKLSSEGTTAAVFLENLQDSLRSVGIALETHLAPEALSARVQRPPLQEKTVLSLAWLPSLLQGAFWFFDGEALHVLPEGEARKRWIEWAKSR